jgi:hypothetical protein
VLLIIRNNHTRCVSHGIIEREEVFYSSLLLVRGWTAQIIRALWKQWTERLLGEHSRRIHNVVLSFCCTQRYMLLGLCMVSCDSPALYFVLLLLPSDFVASKYSVTLTPDHLDRKLGFQLAVVTLVVLKRQFIWARRSIYQDYLPLYIHHI